MWYPLRVLALERIQVVFMQVLGLFIATRLYSVCEYIILLKLNMATIMIVWLILLLSLSKSRSQIYEERRRSFSACNMTDGHPGCALDVPNRTLPLDQWFTGAACPAVGCAWKCQMDRRCLEFNFHSNNMTCDLYYSQPTNYQTADSCTHFKVRDIWNITPSCHTAIQLYDNW